MTTTEPTTDPRRRVISGELLETAEREMMCTCLDDYVRRGMFDPHCRCDDRDDLAKEAYESGKHEMYLAQRDEIAKLQNACQLLGRVVTGHARAMEAARIELTQGDARKAMEWILNSLPDVDDNDPEDQWNGTETAQEWFDRTR